VNCLVDNIRVETIDNLLLCSLLDLVHFPNLSSLSLEHNTKMLFFLSMWF